MNVVLKRYLECKFLSRLRLPQIDLRTESDASVPKSVDGKAVSYFLTLCILSHDTLIVKG